MLPGNCLHKIFEARAAATPTQIAACTLKEKITYRDLDDRAIRFAVRLRAMGVGPNVLVGLCIDRSVELVVAMIAILKAGGAYLPIDPSYPQKRVQFLLTDSGVGLVVAIPKTAPVLEGATTKVVLMDDKDREPMVYANSPDDGANLAYVIYTSGSTGAPKGVEIEHRNVVRLFEQTERWFRFNADDIWTMFHSASFDFSVWEIWGALLYGGKVIIVPYDITRSPELFLSLVEEQGVTVLNHTPSAFRQFVAADMNRSRVGKWKLRLVIFGGERLDLKILQPWISRYGDEFPELVNMYGITETTVHVTYRKISKKDLEFCDISPLGVAIPDLQVHLLDEQGEPVKDGSPGEMYIAGPGLARGYLGRPDLTSRRFCISAKLGPEPTRLYSSGDRAVRSADGQLIYLGRTDAQLKVRGFRIEPYEVESCLGRHPDLATVVVTSHDYGDGDVRLIALLLLRADVKARSLIKLTEEVARRACDELPLHMRPSDYRLVPSLPMTAHGKLDREALPQLVAGMAATHGPSSPLMNTTERAIAAIWEQILQRRNIGVRDDFFDLGGTSLALIRILARLNQQFGTAVDGSALADEATVARLARCVEASRLQFAREAAVPAKDARKIDEITPTPTEQIIAGIWEDVLQRSGVGVTQDFFDSGGTSLALIRILARVNRHFKTSLDGSVMVDDPTISCLAAFVDRQLGATNSHNMEKDNAERTAEAY